ncbi:hypothetical protein F0562_008612 [Nyssa sinensis]|uniref:CCHC-type domain-containing protein n=1 Tax=Nyssa sinensis TaxID=561372 RepID=A0A5J5AA46_9ASTE|nr:hypothetical protein F0562_008612 [Nyssa sinensis]
MGKGKGCFKCGALDHIAKDCTGDPTANQQPSKYILKDGNTQHGGDDNSRFEMVFDEDIAGSPRQDKKRRDYESEDHIEKQKVNWRSSEDLKQRDHEKKDLSDGHRKGDGSREYREHERNRENRTSRSIGSRRDYEYCESHRDKDERDYRDRREDGGRHRDRRDEIDDRKRDADKDARGERRDDRDHGKGSAGNDRRDKRDDSSSRKIGADKDWRRGEGEEQNYRKRSLESGGDHDRYRDRESRHRYDKRR